MDPDLHYQVMVSRSAELREEAARHSLVRKAKAAKKAGERSGGKRDPRAASGGLRTS